MLRRGRPGAPPAQRPHAAAGRRAARRNQHCDRRPASYGYARDRKPDAATARKLEQLARQIAGDSNNEIILELARSAAEAEFDLARVRRAGVALINRVSAFGAIDPFWDELAKLAARMQRLRAEVRHFKALLSGVAAPEIPVQDFIDSAQSMPTPPSERTAEAVRRALPELVKLNRYQVRAASRRNRAIKEISRLKRTEIVSLIANWRAHRVEPEE
jgi:hypothetical protein